jgi:hypothetical protein
LAEERQRCSPARSASSDGSVPTLQETGRSAADACIRGGRHPWRMTRRHRQCARRASSRRQIGGSRLSVQRAARRRLVLPDGGNGCAPTPTERGASDCSVQGPGSGVEAASLVACSRRYPGAKAQHITRRHQPRHTGTPDQRCTGTHNQSCATRAVGLASQGGGGSCVSPSDARRVLRRATATAVLA